MIANIVAIIGLVILVVTITKSQSLVPKPTLKEGICLLVGFSLLVTGGFGHLILK